MASVPMLVLSFLPLTILPSAGVALSGVKKLKTNTAGSKAQLVQVSAEGIMREQRLGAKKTLMRKAQQAGGTEESDTLWFAETAVQALDDSVLRRVDGSDDYGRQPASPYAVVTLICNDRWVPGAIALAASLRHAGLKADSVLMLGTDVSKKYHDVLKANFDHLYQQEALKDHPSIRRVNADCLTLQLRTWELPYKKALFMDADMIVLKSPDRLFSEYGELSAKMDVNGTEFNGGMFMCEPSAKTFARLRDGLSSYQGTKNRTGMQQFLNHMYPHCKAPRPSHYVPAGCMGATFSKEHNQFSRDLQPEEAAAMLQGNSEYDSVHFSGDWETEKKPWMKGCMMTASSTTKYQGDTRDNILNLWKNAYDMSKPPTDPKMPLAAIECPFFDCVRARGSMDFVVHSEQLDCVTSNAISAAIKYGMPKRVLLVAPEAVCRKCLIREVQCVDEETVVPGISKQGIKAWIGSALGEKIKEELLDQHARKWFDEFLKIGLADAAERLSLSQEFLLFDPEMLLIRDFCPYNKKGQVVFMETGEKNGSTCQSHYSGIFPNLMGVPYAISQNYKSFNAHQMVMNTNITRRLLRAVEERHPSEHHWSKTMLKHICVSPETCSCGFPNFGAYASWTRSQHPDMFAEEGQLYRLWRPAAWQLRAKKDKACCPESYDFTQGNLELGMGHQFVRWDRTCKLINWKLLAKLTAAKNLSKLPRPSTGKNVKAGKPGHASATGSELNAQKTPSNTSKTSGAKTAQNFATKDSGNKGDSSKHATASKVTSSESGKTVGK